MASKDRIYLVQEPDSKDKLVRAISAASVRAHMCRGLFTIKAASSEDVASAMTQGAVVEDAKPSPDQAELGL